MVLKPIPYINPELIKPKDISATKCAPHLQFENGSCIPLKLLIEMAEAYNEYHSKDISKQIKLNSKLDTLYPDDYKKYLLYKFKTLFDGDQKDWINSKYLELMSDEAKDYLENKVFRPDGPQGRFDWLSTIDINQVLYQYEEKYPDFKFLGAVPIDFMKLDYLPFKKIKFEDLESESIKRFGIIFNTDESTGRGKHWISLFCDLEKGQIYFSDSAGNRQPDEVSEFMKIIEKYLIDIKKIYEPDIRYNKTQHQKGNSECGVYSINWILRLLKGKTFDHITRKRLTDNQVNKCRVKYFAKSFDHNKKKKLTNKQVNEYGIKFLG
jgi:hypothetical protein